MKTVRIQRRRKSFAKQCTNLANCLNTATAFLLKPYISQQQTVIEEARYQRLQAQVQIDTQRAHKLANDVVKGDLEIELLKAKLQLAEAELKLRNIGHDFEVDNYSSDRSVS